LSITFRQCWHDFSSSAIARHSAGLAALLLLLCALLTQLAIDWRASDRDPIETAARLESLRNSTLPFHGAGDRIARTKAAIEDFSARRIPLSYSQVSSRIVEIGMSSGVQLSHTIYDQRSRGAYLTEVSIESQVSGTYPQIMRFVNGLERDQACFVIRAMSLSGQQGGEVNLQLRFSTWLRPAAQPAPDMATARLEHEMAGSGKENE
jgi:type IV pilus assembly protein PilO